MKKTALLFFVFVSVATHAQDTKLITEQFAVYNKLINDRNFEKALDHVNEGLFTIAPREQMLKFMEQTLNNPDLVLESSLPEASQFGETKKINDQYFVKFSSFTVVKMKFNNLISSDKSAEENQSMVNMVMANLNASFGEGNVSYDDKTQFFTVKATKPVIAASGDRKTWKFLTIDNDQMKPLLEGFIPKELLD